MKKDGKRVYITEVIADEVYFCGGKSKERTEDTGLDDDDFEKIDDPDMLPF